MSVVNEFKARRIRYSLDTKQVYITDEQGSYAKFSFDIYCHVQPMATKFHLFFDIRTSRLLIVYNNSEPFALTDRFECGLMKFWIDKDSPVASCHWLTNMTQIMDQISEQFKEQLASFTIDQIINS